MSARMMVETWGELGAIPDIKEIMPLETKIANELKAEGVIESLYVKDGAKGAYIICAETDKAKLEEHLKRLPFYPHFSKVEYTLVKPFWD